VGDCSPHSGPARRWVHPLSRNAQLFEGVAISRSIFHEMTSFNSRRLEGLLSRATTSVRAVASGTRPTSASCLRVCGFGGLGNGLSQLTRVLNVQSVKGRSDQTEGKLGDGARGDEKTVPSTAQIDYREVVIYEPAAVLGAGGARKR